MTALEAAKILDKEYRSDPLVYRMFSEAIYTNEENRVESNPFEQVAIHLIRLMATRERGRVDELTKAIIG